AQVQVAIGVAAQAFVFLVGDVDATGEAHAAVDHHDLAVRAQVEPRAFPDATEAHRVEPGEFATGRQQGREKALRAMRRADRIEQQAHHHAVARTLRQRIADGRAGRV